MFESAELGHKLDKATFDRDAPALRQALLDAQLDLLERREFPVVILIAGVDGAGKGETVNLLNEWMDPRHVHTYAMGDLTAEEQEHPPLWRFWQALPPKGKVGVFFGSWYTDPILQRVYGHAGDPELDQAAQEIVRFEDMLAAEGALVLKFWFHLSKKQQRRRLKHLESDAHTRWRVTDQDWKNHKRYDSFIPVCERMLRQTSTGNAPWIVVEGADPQYRHLTVAKSVQTALRHRLDAAPDLTDAPPPPPSVASVDAVHLLGALDYASRMERKQYDAELADYQGRLNYLSRQPEFKRLSMVAVFEGFDAAGKGGAIRRVTAALDARQYKIHPVAAPTEEERAQPYLWRFWRRLPRRGELAVFDRSWYGRVLVERIEGFCSVGDWTRAYREINDFEEQLTRHRYFVTKFWLSITKDEQAARFKQREETGFKQYKITAEDWRNRERWEDYERAVSDMVDHTSTELAPWTVVPANDKWYARVRVLKTLCHDVEAAMNQAGRR